MDQTGLNISLEFSGGAELLFDGKKKIDVILDSSKKCEYLYWTLTEMS